MRVLFPHNSRGNKKLRRANIEREEARKERERERDFTRILITLGSASFERKRLEGESLFLFFFSLQDYTRPCMHVAL